MSQPARHHAADEPRHTRASAPALRSEDASGGASGAGSPTTLYLGLDLGTSSLKALVTDRYLRVHGVVSRSYPLLRARPGWAEQDPNAWWAALRAALDALRARGIPLERIAAIGVTGQMHGALLYDQTAQSLLGLCQTWADARCAVEARLVERRVGRAALIAIAGSRANTSATAAKALWIRRHDPDRWRAATHLLFPKDALRWRLTGALATDPSDACGALLCDLATRDWSPILLDAFDLPRAMLPPIREPDAIAGALTAEAATTFGLPAGVPVVTGAGDAECAALGLGVFDVAGERLHTAALATLGTAGQFFIPTNRPLTDPSGRLQALCHGLPARWHLMGAILSGSSALDWLAHALAPAGAAPVPIETLLAEAASEPPGAHGLLFLPHLHGARLPDMNPDASGVFIGLRPEHGRGALTRAVMEGVALALREGLEVARELGIQISHVRLAGGANRHTLWSRIQADVFDLPVERGATEDASALGAALLAALGVGAIPSPRDARHLVCGLETTSTTLLPDAAAAARYTQLAATARDLAPRLHATYTRLARFTHDDA